ncbi:MAG: hypothetical protein O2954_09160 [bacterium]|nr:hypothetical protein [bacterium]
MSATEFKSGDWVWYIDADQLRWGPWRVLDVCENRVRVNIENLLTDTVPHSQLQKVIGL